MVRPLPLKYRIQQFWNQNSSAPRTAISKIRKIKYECSIVNTILKTKVVQKFINAAENQLSRAEYYFPIEEGVCLEQFVAKYAGNTVNGIVKEKEEARKEFNESKLAGNVVSYAETKKTETEDYVVIKLENIPPLEEVEITLSFSQQITSMLNKYYSATIPLAYVEDDEAIAANEDVLSLELLCTGRITYAESKGYPVNKEMLDENSAKITLKHAFLQENIPFQLVFAFEGMFEATVIFGASKPFEVDQVKQAIIPPRESATVSFLPNFNSTVTEIDDEVRAALARGEDVQSDEFQARISEEMINHIDASRSEFIFLLDRSGSMSGAPINKAVDALSLFLKSLPNDSYFNVISFGSSFKLLFNKSQKYTSDSLNNATKAIKGYSADLGGTSIYQPLEQVLVAQQKLVGYNKQVFLLTDGAVENPKNVVRLIKANNRFNRVHSIGFGSGADKYLIEESAKAGKGISQFVRMDQDLSDLVLSMLARSISPTLDDFQIKYDQSVIESVYPELKDIPCLFKNEIFNFHIFFKPQIDICSLSESQKTLNISFIDSTSKNKQEYQLKLEATDVFAFNQSLKESVFKLSKQLQLTDLFEKKPSQNIEQGLIHQAVDFQLLTSKTAMVCTIASLNDIQKVQFSESISQNVGFSGGLLGSNSDSDNEQDLKRNMKKCKKPSSAVQRSRAQQPMPLYAASSSSSSSALNQCSTNSMSYQAEKQQGMKREMLLNTNSSSMLQSKSKAQSQSFASKVVSSISSMFSSKKSMAPPPSMAMAMRRSMDPIADLSSNMNEQLSPPPFAPTPSMVMAKKRSMDQIADLSSNMNESLPQKRKSKQMKQQLRMECEEECDEDSYIDAKIEQLCQKEMKQNSIQSIGGDLLMGSMKKSEFKAERTEKESVRKLGGSNPKSNLESWLNSVDFQGVWKYDQQKLNSEIIFSDTDLSLFLSKFKVADAFMTLVVICILEIRFATQKNKWNLISKKSFSWVKLNINDGENVNEIKAHFINLLNAN